jgi:hypothetical protein
MSKGRTAESDREAANNLLVAYFTRVFDTVAAAYDAGGEMVVSFPKITVPAPKSEDVLFSSRICDIRLRRALSQRAVIEEESEKNTNHVIQEYKAVLDEEHANITESFTPAEVDRSAKPIHIRNAEKDEAEAAAKPVRKSKRIDWNAIKAAAAARVQQTRNSARGKPNGRRP